VAEGATFVLGGIHRTDTVTTSFLERAHGTGSKRQADIAVGSDVWIAGNSTILSGATIGDGAVVGAGSVVINDVPPYAMVFGNPARVHRKRFSAEVIDALLELRWWDLDRGQIQLMRPLLLSDDINLFIDKCRELRGLPCSRKTHAARAEIGSSSTANDSIAPASGPCPAMSAKVVALIQSEIPALSSDNLDTPFQRLDVDSMGMITLRAELEQSFEILIDDEAWTSVVTPADVVRIVSTIETQSTDGARTAPACARRVYSLNMPQMALGGLSESWLFKEIGDIHWTIITDGLRMPSSELKDGNGQRLYATFTRFQLSATASVAAYAENERVAIDAQTSRYGAGLFFTEATVRGDGKSARARVMSSFSKFGETRANTSLLKGQPEIPPGCAIQALADLPEFAREYRARRSGELAATIFECEYQIIPCHDINGVGLLYFAAYPMINDICAARHAGRSFMTHFATRERDVLYFANSDPDETLVFRIHRWRASDARIEMEASLSRKSDGVLMAVIVTLKDRCPT
jgi:probable biosynthetic protein (TIGR04098 family)